MPFEYKCPSCQATGDLDSFVNQIECPNCGGMMNPVTAPTQTDTSAADVETPTTVVPGSEILKEAEAIPEQPKRVVKVAKFVNIGFGGMLTTSATRGFKPIRPGRKDASFPFSQTSIFDQQDQNQTAPADNTQEPGHADAAQRQIVSSSSTSLGDQRKKTFTIQKSKTPGNPPQQTSTQQMDATHVDPRITSRIPRHGAANATSQPVQGIFQSRRKSGPASASLKFLPKGALKVAQTHTSIQRAQIPPQSQTQNPFQTQQEIPRQYEQQPPPPDYDEDFAAQVCIEAERREAILREAYRIAEANIRREREESGKYKAEINAPKKETAPQPEKQTELPEDAAKKAAEKLITQISGELAETEELIRKEREILELRKKELRKIRESAEEENTKEKQTQGNKIILSTPQKPVKLKSGEGSESLMRSSKNLQIDQKMLQTGKQVLTKEEIEKINSNPRTTETTKDAGKGKFTISGIGMAALKEKSQTKSGINTPAAPMTNSTLLEIRRKKKTMILLMAGLALAAVCLLIIFIGGEMIKKARSFISAPPSAVVPTSAQDNLPANIRKGSPLQAEYNAVYQKTNKTPSNIQEIDDNIIKWQDFISNHPDATDTDSCIRGAKTHIKNMQDLKELY